MAWGRGPIFAFVAGQQQDQLEKIYGAFTVDLPPFAAAFSQKLVSADLVADGTAVGTVQSNIQIVFSYGLHICFYGKIRAQGADGKQDQPHFFRGSIAAADDGTPVFAGDGDTGHQTG